MKRLLSVAWLTLTLFAAVSVSSAIDRRQGRPAQRPAPRGPYDTPAEAREKAALSHYLSGMELEKSQDMFGALAQYDTALVYDPSSYTVRMAYVRAAASLGQFEAARDAAGKLARDDTDALQVLVNLYRQARMPDSVLYYLNLLAGVDSTDVDSRKALASYYERQGDLDSAIPYRAQIARLKGSFQAYNEVGALQFLTGKFQDAVESFERAIKIEPGARNIPSYSGLADALGESGDTVRQRQVLAEALALDSTHIPTHRRFIDYYTRKRQFDSALIHSRMEVALAPQDKAAIKRLGIIAYSADSLDLAEEQFDELIGIGDVEFTNYFFLGRIFLEKRNFSYALINFRTAVRAADTISEGWLGLGQTYQAMDSLPQAADIYQEGSNRVKAPNDKVRLLFSLGAVRERLGEMELSEKAFERVLEIDTLHAPTLNYLGYMLVDRNERLSFAKDLIRRALEVNPDSGPYIDSYGWALFREGKYEQARDSLQRALELIDSDPTVFDHLGDTFDKLGMPDSARVYWRRALKKDSADATLKEKIEEKLNR